MTEPWSAFDDRRAASRAPASEQTSDPDLAELCAAVFTTPSGRDLLLKLREEHVDRRHGPAVPSDVLRFYEGQRQLVLGLELQRDKGLLALAAAKKNSAAR